MKPVAIIYSDWGPYHLARLRAFCQVVPEAQAIGIASFDKTYSFWGKQETGALPLEVLFPGVAFEDIPVKEQIEALHASLEGHDPASAVIAGYSQPVMRAAARWARDRHRASILLCVSWAGDRRRWWPKERLKGQLLRSLFDAAFVGGERQLSYMQSLGFPRERIWKLQNVVDNDFFAEQAGVVRADEAAWRARLGLPPRYFLFVGRLIPVKNLWTLLRAYRDYRKSAGQWDLVMLGTGKEEAALKAWASAGTLPGIHWVGAKPYQELPPYYALASCLVLPSTSEPWGLVVNEAEACGLPVLVSEACGCLPELVQRGVNGYDFNPTDSTKLAELMLHTSGGNVDLTAFGEASRRLVSCYAPEAWAFALNDCVARMAELRRTER